MRPGLVKPFMGHSEAAAPPFDAALMAAMNRPHPDLVFASPKIVASGMTPPDLVNP